MTPHYFFNKLWSFIKNFPVEWRKSIKEQGNKHIYFLTYSAVFLMFSFLIGSLWYFGLQMGFVFIAIHSIVFGILIFTYLLALAYLFEYFSNYYNWNLQKNIPAKTIIYTHSFYILAHIIGSVFSPENYFFILFLGALLSSYYFMRIIAKRIQPAIIYIIISTVLFILDIASYFIFNNILASL